MRRLSRGIRQPGPGETERRRMQVERDHVGTVDAKRTIWRNSIRRLRQNI